MIVYLKGLSLIGAGICLTQLVVWESRFDKAIEPLFAGLLLILAGIIEVKERLDERKSN